VTLQLTRERARRLAIMGQLLDAERPKGLLDAVERLGRVQMDPTAVVARTEHLVLYSRVGAYERAALEQLMWKDRKLFEYWAFIVPMADLHLYQHTMRRVLVRDRSRARYMRKWLMDNEAFRRRVMRELARRGPLKSRDIDDESRVEYTPGGWNAGRNVTRMLDVLWAIGDIAIVGREGQERVWGIAKDWYPKKLKRATEREIAREIVSRQLATKGVARVNEFGYSFDGRPPGWEEALAGLEREGLAVPARIDNVRGSFYAWAPLLERRFRGRSAILSPFDRLIHDRRRSEELFDFDYRLEIYVPRTQRRWGYYVLPVLQGDRFVARLDARREPETGTGGTLRVLAVYAEPGVTPASAGVVSKEVKGLARWLGLRKVEYDRVPRLWRRELEG
jgi:uncharacterized protein YcaQ